MLLSDKSVILVELAHYPMLLHSMVSVKADELERNKPDNSN